MGDDNTLDTTADGTADGADQDRATHDYIRRHGPPTGRSDRDLIDWEIRREITQVLEKSLVPDDPRGHEIAGAVHGALKAAGFAVVEAADLKLTLDVFEETLTSPVLLDGLDDNVLNVPRVAQLKLRTIWRATARDPLDSEPLTASNSGSSLA